jgi:hypothetical protein
VSIAKTMQTSSESLSLGNPEDSMEKGKKTRSKARERVEIVLTGGGNVGRLTKGAL